MEITNPKNYCTLGSLLNSQNNEKLLVENICSVIQTMIHLRGREPNNWSSSVNAIANVSITVPNDDKLPNQVQRKETASTSHTSSTLNNPHWIDIQNWL